MQLSQPVEKNGLTEEILRVCGVTSAVYTNYAMVSRLNNALDRYWYLASQSAPKGVFDDTNNTSVPIETQNLVSGTNTYKLSDFTNNVLQILRVSVLDEDGIEHDLKREDFDDIQDLIEQYDTSLTGVSEYYAIIGDYIYIRSCPDYNETAGLRLYANRELSKFEWVTCTSTFATDKIDATAHGLSDNDSVIFETDSSDLPSGLTADTTVYYVINKTADDFEVSTVLGGTKVALADDGTGNHKFTKVNKEPGIPVIHHDYLARNASLPFLIEKKLPQTGAIGQRIYQDEDAIKDYWANRDPELKTRIETKQRVFK